MTSRKIIAEADEISLKKYFKDINKIKTMTKAEEKKLRIELHDDNKYRQELVLHNLRFVAKIASKYQNMGLPLSDLISEGNLGLIKASQEYDPSRDNKFFSYAVYWIKNYITLALDNAKVERDGEDLPEEYEVLKYGATAENRSISIENDEATNTMVRELLGVLSPKENAVISLTYGIGNTHSYNLEETG